MSAPALELPAKPIANIRALSILGASIGLGIAADLLLRGVTWGLGFPVWVGLCLLAGWRLWRKPVQAQESSVAWLAVPLLVFSACLALRDSGAMRAMNLFAFFMALAILSSRIRIGGVGKISVGDLVGGWLAHWALMLADAWNLVFADISWRGFGTAHGRERMAVVGRGMLIAVPILIVFGALLTSADPVFSSYLANLTDWNLEAAVGHTFGIFLGTWAVASLFRRLFLAPEAVADPRIWHSALGAPPNGQVPLLVGQPPAFQIGEPAGPPKPKAQPGIGNAEAGIALGSLILLLGAFSAVQIRFLFGGAAALPEGMNWSQYARGGFFQLLAVLMLAVPVLRLVHHGLKLRGANGPTYPTLVGITVGLLGIVVASAMRRLDLCVEQYNWSELRLYGGAAMVWIAGCLVWLLATVVARKSNHFVIGAVTLGFLAIFGLNLINPDAMIARSMLLSAVQKGRMDSAYLSRLSLDSLPEVAAAMEGLPLHVQTDLRDRLTERWSELEPADWRSWSLGDQEGRKALGELKLYELQR
ncbi:MAG: DUF4173 domain-containing protein [Armatimonadetes bacterium]|nr:DUF4173 domain-containing protein [Armatimonadota bacterium]